MNARRHPRSRMRMLRAAVLLAIASLALPALAAPRDAAVETLSGVDPSWNALGLRAWINDGDTPVLRVGDDVRYSFETAADAHLLVLHVDSQGVVSVLQPSTAYQETLVEGGKPRSIPEAGTLSLEVSPPLGQEDVFVFATREPISAEALDLGAMPAGLRVVESAESAAYAERIAGLLGAQGDVAAKRLTFRVVGRGDLDMTKADIVAYFETRTRAIRRPKLDLHVRFDSGSAELTQQARDQLDQMGQALQSLDQSFTIGGHTDDVGDESYNEALSRRRAAAVRGYLTDKFGIEADRLEVRAYGESAPIESGTTSDARASNRRVEFEVAP